jgi:hypothetical protein
MPDATPQAMDTLCRTVLGELSKDRTMAQRMRSKLSPAGHLISSMTRAARPVQGQQKPYTCNRQMVRPTLVSPIRIVKSVLEGRHLLPYPDNMRVVQREQCRNFCE